MCRLSSLTKVCRNYYKVGRTECYPANVPLLDFLKINYKLEKLKEQEEAVKA